MLLRYLHITVSLGIGDKDCHLLPWQSSHIKGKLQAKPKHSRNILIQKMKIMEVVMFEVGAQSFISLFPNLGVVTTKGVGKVFSGVWSHGPSYMC